MNASAKETVSMYLARFLEAKGVTHVFELVGGMITVMIDSIHAKSDLHVISMHHEQGAGFAAEGFGRVAGTPAVAMATSGPGATNLLTAIGSCYFDSVPCLFITGQVNTFELKGDRKIRQLGFQETDIVSMATPITKMAVQARSADEVPELLERCWAEAVSGRPGPVLIDIPMNVQREAVPSSPAPVRDPVHEDSRSAIAEFNAALANALKNCTSPLFLLGGGIRTAGVAEDVRDLVRRSGIPAVHSLMGVDALCSTMPERVGMIGSYGNRWANKALANSDLLIVLGSRLDVRQTGADTSSFKGERKIFHVDCMEGEMNNRVTDCEVLQADLGVYLQETNSGDLLDGMVNPSWSSQILAWKAEFPHDKENVTQGAVNPNEALEMISRLCPENTVFVTDVGQHQMWAAQSLQIGEDARFLTSGGMGSMGFGLPAAIGAAYAGGGQRPVVLIAGDGGFQCNIQELQTIVRNQLPITLVVMNNHCHGMVRQFQESYFDNRYHSTQWGYDAPEFWKVAEAYGLRSFRLTDPENVKEDLRMAMTDLLAPCLIEIEIDSGTNAYPKMAFGRAFGEMEPGVKPLEMEGT